MKIIPRQLEAVCRSDLTVFPVLTVTGPRQSGKSTLLKSILPDWIYVNLEDPSNLDFALDDPKGFIRTYGDKVIIDEIQKAPKLLSYLQVEVDRDRRPGRFALTGSHNLLLLEHVSQSLAGRTSIRHLLPFSYSEVNAQGADFATIEENLFYGGYPLVYQHPQASGAWLDSYIQTYVERDVRTIRNVSDLATFRRFVRLCAGRASQLLDLSGIGADAGLTHNTVRQWVGVMEAGFIAFRLEPYFRNFSKRIIKSPKLYFYDTGLLCRLLEIRSARDLETSSFRGAIFENWCVLEALKAYHNRGERPGIYFWRDQSMEVDLLMELSPDSLAAIECKSGLTPPRDALQSPGALRNIMKGLAVSPAVIYGGTESQQRSDGKLLGWSVFGDQLTKKAYGFEM
jgi:uncharacterized protein